MFCLASWARAEVYEFVDEDGVIHFTNVPPDGRYKLLDDRGRPRSRKKQPAKAPKAAAGKVRRSDDSRPYAQRSRVRTPSRKTETDEYDTFIVEASERFDIPAALVRAVIAVESNFDPQAVSHAGAEGLMQLMPETAKQVGVEDTFDPRQNILGGTRYLRQLANAFAGDLVLTLAAYNAGQQRVVKHNDIPPIDETQIYVRRVLQLYYHYKKLYGPPAEDESP
ncbi:MAG TPA: lytic transglycosylase domain-containing protein [Myxococcota bacterium]|nr:lytic transglycosylase domain-containing protein [Myxococcota bacterium]